jgi:hypothetical protein
MDVKIKFLDDFSLDRKLYWRVADIYNRYQWEIQYERLSLESPWMIRRHGSDVWHPIDGKKIAVELSARQIDADDFDRQLSSNIMTQAVFCSNLIDEAKKIFGAKSIEDAISNHNEFAEKLLEMIQDLTKQGGLKDSFEYSENISAEPVDLNDILGDFPTSASLFELTEPSSKPNSRLRLVKK